MAKFDKKLEAQSLRKRGWSIRSIAFHLSVSKGSVSSWCADIKLTSFQKEHLIQNAIKAGHRGRMLGAEANRRKKEDAISFYNTAGRRDIGRISRRDLLLIGTALYWGEGTKAPKRQMAFVNSDPAMIMFMYTWFQRIMGVKTEDFMPRIFINEIHRPRIDKVLKFWSNLLALPQEQFGNPFFVKTKQKKIYENYDSYYGILALKVRRGTHLKYRIVGLIDALREHEQNLPV